MSERPGGDVAYAFIVGCPRSGTTWLQLLLAQHSEVATVQETHLFRAYLAPLYARWKRELEAWDDEERAGERGWGLSPLLDERAFDDLCRGFAEGVLARALPEAAPEEGGRRPVGVPARVLVEKTPSHCLHAGLIRRLLPGARFLHVVRDPRAVAASLRRASRRWWGGWAPERPEEAAAWWVEHVQAGLAIPSAACRRVRYERLHEDAARELAGALRFLGVTAAPEACEEAAARCRIERLRGGASDVRSPRPLSEAPDGFYAEGKVEGWREELSPAEIAAVEAVAGPLMGELGYAPATRDPEPVR